MSKQTIQKRAPLLVELGTEELPPAALKTLAIAFHEHLLNALGEAGVLHEAHSRWFATPRRLAVLIEDVATKGAAQNVEKEGLRSQPPMMITVNRQRRSSGLRGRAALISTRSTHLKQTKENG